MENKKLRQKLIEDLGTGDAVDELLPVVAALQKTTTPQPTAKETSQLLAALEPMLPQQAAATKQWRAHLQWAYWLLRAQMRIVRAELWLGSAFVIALGVLVTLAADLQALPFVLIAPIVAAVGITFLYGPSNDPALEIELTTAVSPITPFNKKKTPAISISKRTSFLGLFGSFIISLLRCSIFDISYENKSLSKNKQVYELS